jgi:hypothetical protein
LFESGGQIDVSPGHGHSWLTTRRRTWRKEQGQVGGCTVRRAPGAPDPIGRNGRNIRKNSGVDRDVPRHARPERAHAATKRQRGRSNSREVSVRRRAIGSGELMPVR